jgi:FkbM family methyltransferase
MSSVGIQKSVMFRPFTQDIQVLFEVLEHNKYCVEDVDCDAPVIDIGAHIGAFALACLRKGARHVVCYEPDPDNIELLAENLYPYVGKVRVSEEAVSGVTRPGFIQSVTEDRTASSHIFSSGGCHCDVLGINDLLIRHPVIKLLKISANGAEKAILESAKDMSGVEAICGEVFFRMAAKGSTKPTDTWITKRLYQLGFKKFALIHDRHDPHGKATFFGKRK